MAAPVIGRAAEGRAIERLLAGLADGCAVLAVEGEAGMGKTTILRAAAAAARRRGVRVRACAGSAAERRLAHAGLADLLGDVEDEALHRLPAPQRVALDAALLRGAPHAAPLDRRAVATAALTLLERLAEERPQLVAVDDLDVLDRPTARVLEFCARRLTGRVGLVVTRASGAAQDWVAGLAGLREPVRAETVRLAPLGDDELLRLLRARLRRPIPAPALTRALQVAAGNPLFALELAQAPGGGPSGPAPPLPPRLARHVAARLAGLDGATQEALLAAAALAEPTVELLERALGPDARARLEPAEERGLVVLDGPRVRFAHPLLAHGAYARAGPCGRRAVHRALAAAVPDPEQRARHLARAGMAAEAGPALERAAVSACARGDPGAAAEALELALGLGGDVDLRRRAAGHHVDAGDPRRARVLVEEGLRGLGAGPDRARALLLLAEARAVEDGVTAARALARQAREEAASHPHLRVVADLRLAVLDLQAGAVAGAAATARSAVAHAQGLGDDPLLAQALAVAVLADFTQGRGLDERRLARALALEDAGARTAPELRPSLVAAALALWTARFERSRALLGAPARPEGFLRVWLGCWAGDLAGAAEAAEAAFARPPARDATPVGRALALTARAQLDAYQGRVRDARPAAEEACALLEHAGWRTAAGWPLTTLGFLELSVGRPAAAAARLAPAAAAAVAGGLAEPAAGGLLLTGDAAEALVALGRTQEAEAIVVLLEARGAALGRTWAIAVGARCRGLLLAAQGDVAAAEAALERALVAHERLPMPIERARSLLVLGRIRRRRRRRLAAKAALGEALAIFTTVGSPRWAEQATAEIACLGLRPHASQDLTPAEERVARAAAAGLTNQEAAALLMVSPKTVEAQLARTYRKLGIHSRAELGARMAAQPPR